MGGVVIGCAITQFQSLANKPRAVAMTINNTCNLKCPHCYLQYSRPTSLPDKQYVTEILKQEFEHLAVVGMEPLFDRESAHFTADLIHAARAAGKSVSIITNGLNLTLLPKSAAGLLTYIDVSFDGGPVSYRKNRGGSFDRLSRNVQEMAPFAPLNALHTLYQENLSDLDDMLLGTEALPIAREMFSPYVRTRNEGSNGVRVVNVSELVAKLSHSKMFLERDRAFLLLDQYHLDTEALSQVEAKAIAKSFNFEERVTIVPFTPLQVGTVRATYDGLLLSPAAALHTADYSLQAIDARSTSLESAFAAFVEAERSSVESARVFPIRVLKDECELMV